MEKYGTPEFYSEMFSDILADVDPMTASTDNIYRGFLMAIDSWLEYHETQVDLYADLKARVTRELGVTAK